MINRKGNIEGLKIAICGDILHSRVARSNIYLMNMLGAEVNVIKFIDSLPAPIVLLVKDKQGYINLTKIVSKAYVDGQVNGEPMVELSLLQKYSKGLIALSGGMEGHVGQSILAGNIPLTESRIKFFKSIFYYST